MQMINTRLTTATTLAPGAAIPVGNIVHKSGNAIDANGSIYSVDGCGYYRILANVSIAPTAAAAMTITLSNNGNVIATATATPSDAAASVNLSLIGAIYKKCNCVDNLLTITVSAAGTVTESDVVIERM